MGGRALCGEGSLDWVWKTGGGRGRPFADKGKKKERTFREPPFEPGLLSTGVVGVGACRDQGHAKINFPERREASRLGVLTGNRPRVLKKTNVWNHRGG